MRSTMRRTSRDPIEKKTSRDGMDPDKRVLFYILDIAEDQLYRRGKGPMAYKKMKLSHVPTEDDKKPRVPTEDENKPLARCPGCNKITDHGYFNCPDREIVHKMMFPFCTICLMKTDHDTPDCPKATPELLEKLCYCRICDKNTDHHTFDCKKENGFTWHNGIRVPNVCSLCREFGHVSQLCPEDSDGDLDCDPLSDDGW